MKGQLLDRINRDWPVGTRLPTSPDQAVNRQNAERPGLVEYTGDQIRGSREGQEDSLTARRFEEPAPGNLFVIADGMGGYLGGAEASRTATRAFVEAFAVATNGSVSARLAVALQAADKSIATRKADEPQLGEMGCTLLAVFLSEGTVQWISVGDSPLWLLRAGRLRRLNADHSMRRVLAEMVQQGQLSEEEARRDPGRHVLLSALIGEEIELVDQSVPQALEAGDALILASDGLLTLEEDEMLKTVEGAEDSDEAVR